MLDKTKTPKYKLPIEEPKHTRFTLIMVLVCILAFACSAIGMWFLLKSIHKPANDLAAETKTVAKTSAPTTQTPVVAGTQLDITKNYGNKYASNLLPVGDSKYVTTGAKKGSVYACAQYAQNFASDKGGAGTRGPWFVNNNTQYDVSKKVHVAGSVIWKGSFSNTLSGGKRMITTNDLPLAQSTGTFPIASSDPAYSYDRNPNTISAQSLTYTLNASPTYGNAQCMGGEVGVMLSGVAIFNAFDAGGRDAGAWEVQDACSGHPQSSGEYHYHTLSSCITDISVHTVIGFALDGFPITGPQVAPGSILTTDDLDDCHGTTSQINLDGKAVTSYHYVMTQDFPYSASCFRSTAAQPPGMQGGGGQTGQAGQSSGQAPNQTQPQPSQQGGSGSAIGSAPPQAKPPVPLQ